MARRSTLTHWGPVMGNKKLMAEASRFRSKEEKRTFKRDMLLTLAAVALILLIRSL